MAVEEPRSWAEEVKLREKQRASAAVTDGNVVSYGRKAEQTKAERAAKRGLGATESAGGLVKNTLTQHWKSNERYSEEEKLCDEHSSRRFKKRVPPPESKEGDVRAKAKEEPNEALKETMPYQEEDGWIGNRLISTRKAKGSVEAPAKRHNGRRDLFAHLQMDSGSCNSDLLLQDSWVGNKHVAPQGGKKPLRAPQETQEPSQDEDEKALNKWRGRREATEMERTMHWEAIDTPHRPVKGRAPKPERQPNRSDKDEFGLPRKKQFSSIPGASEPGKGKDLLAWDSDE